MKKIIILSPGNSGGGAIHDYLMSRKDVESPFEGNEFRFNNDPNGLNDLHKNLYNNFSINGAANAFYEFENFYLNIYSTKIKNKKLFKPGFLNLVESFLKNIIEVEYSAIPKFYRDKMSTVKKIEFQVLRRILKKRTNELNLFKMRIPKSNKIFIKFAEILINKIIQNNLNKKNVKNIVVDQSGSFWSPKSSTIFFGKNRKIIKVTRDPRGIFWSMKRRDSFGYPGTNIDTFIKWYKRIMSQRVKEDKDKDVLLVKFEKFIENFYTEKKKLEKFLNLNSKVKDTFDLEFSKKNLYKAKNNLSKKDQDKIKKHLGNYLQW